MPPVLLPPDWPVPAARQIVRPSIAQGRTRTPPPWLADYERPIVVVTFGTIFNHRPELWARTVEAVADLPVDVVATYGRGRPVPDVGPVPANVRFEPYVDLAAVLPSCAAVVTHGGYGTVVAALLHGVPLCCIPLTADHPVNTFAVEQSGAGVSCTTGFLERFPIGVTDPALLTAGAVRDTLTVLLDDPSYRSRGAGGRQRRSRVSRPSTSPSSGSPPSPERAVDTSPRPSPSNCQLLWGGPVVQETLPMPTAARESQAAKRLAYAPSPRDQLVVRAELDEPPVVDDRDPVGTGRGREAVRDHDDRAALGQALERALDRALGAGVEVRRRLVEHEQRRVGERGARERHELPLPRRQPRPALAHLGVEPVGEARRSAP